MATISFKSSGKTSTITKIEADALTSSPIPVGIKTPLRLGKAGDGIFAVHYDVGDAVADNLKNLILTNHGERYGRFNFGANLRELTTEFTNLENFDGEAIIRIKNAVSQWMPYVELENFSSTMDHEKNQNVGILRMLITYNIQALGIQNKALEVTLYVV